MARKFTQVKPTALESVIQKNFKTLGFALTDEQAALALRLMVSGIGHYFFKNPDDLVELGFLRFRKSPAKEELFNVEIIYDSENGIINARTLDDFYRGNKFKEGKLQEIVDSFIEELLAYSQQQEMVATEATNKIQKNIVSRKGKSVRNNNKGDSYGI